MTLRVIAGKAKGRKLKSVPGDTTRPVTDRVKEALFNILAGDVIDSRWWDLWQKYIGATLSLFCRKAPMQSLNTFILRHRNILKCGKKLLNWSMKI